MMYMYMDPTVCTSERYRVSVMYIYGSTHTHGYMYIQCMTNVDCIIRVQYPVYTCYCHV